MTTIITKREHQYFNVENPLNVKNKHPLAQASKSSSTKMKYRYKRFK